MALTVPGADYRQLRGKSTVPLSPQVINVHTMAGTLAGTESWFSGAGRAYSHLGTGGGGELRQWQDLRFRAASDLGGNPRCISIENEDMGRHFPSWSGSDVPEFTDAQADLLVVTLSWLCHRFGLPKSAIRSSCTHERGIGWHRLGIDPWRRSGCPHWSRSRGKACPGDRRIAQLVNEIIPQVSTPSTGDWFDVASEAQLAKVIRQELDREGTRLHHMAMALQVSPGERENYLGRHIKAARYRADKLPTLDQINLVAIAAARFVRDEKPDQEVDLDELAKATADAARQAVTEALPAALADLDAKTVAAAVVEALPPELARQVVVEIGTWLSEADGS